MIDQENLHNNHINVEESGTIGQFLPLVYDSWNSVDKTIDDDILKDEEKLHSRNSLLERVKYHFW